MTPSKSRTEGLRNTVKIDRGVSGTVVSPTVTACLLFEETLVSHIKFYVKSLNQIELTDCVEEGPGDCGR